MSGVKQGRRRRVLRRVAKGVVVLALVLTLASFGYNQYTATPAALPAGLKYVQTGDVSTRYTVAGESGSPIVLVHGAAETAETWQAVVAQLSATHRVYAYDIVGWGYTQRVAPYGIDHAAQQLLAFVDALKLEKPVLVGHSSGAGVIVEAALRSPDRYGGVMLLDGDALDTGPGAGSGAGRVLTKLFIPPFRTTVLRLVLRQDSLITSIYQRQCGPRCPALDAAGIDAYRRPFQIAGAEAGVWDMMGVGVLGVSQQRLEQLASVKITKSVVFGAQDEVFDVDAPAKIAATIGAPAPQIIPDARHLTQLSDPEVVAAAIEDLAKQAQG